ALMAVESSSIPFPSEVVIPPAAFVANQPESVLYATDVYWVNVLIIVFFGTLGAIIGALINYYLSRWLGRPIIYKFADSKLGHLCLLSGVKIERAEVYFREHGNMSTFIGRFIPGIRQLISIPAGLAKMKLLPFLLYTFLGAFIWNCVLALLGYFAAGNIDTIKKYSHELSVAILVIVGAAIVYFVVKSIVNSRKKKQ
ncbi:MAG: DedA family protein, partial [Paludibacteraceae bacterium]|nr:DedA family protein [Paludibacteraceae bacterium]